jgi:DNA-directed RNA polymerase specialized sigma24 family protein
MLGLTAEEAGETLGVKASTVRSLSRQGRESFRRVLGVVDV